jgi:hypothetical protein
MIKIYEIIQDIEKGVSPTNVAKKHHITNPEGGYDVKAIQGIKRIIERNVRGDNYAKKDINAVKIHQERKQK